MLATMNFLQNHLIFRQPERVLYPKYNTQKTHPKTAQILTTTTTTTALVLMKNILTFDLFQQICMCTIQKCCDFVNFQNGECPMFHKSVFTVLASENRSREFQAA